MEFTISPGIITQTFPQLAPESAATLANQLDRLAQALENQNFTLPTDEGFQAQLTRVMLFSPYSGDAFIQNPTLLKELADAGDLNRPHAPDTLAQRAQELCETSATHELGEALFQFKLRENLRIAWRDLNQLADLEETLTDLSDLACACISQGLDFLHQQLCLTHGTPMDSQGNPMEMIILGMGKLGASELNFSSDIDLIFVYPEDGYTQLNGAMETANVDFFTRLCKRFLALFQGGNGMNFYRVDTRLRPFGDAGPLVMSASAFEDYYQAHGREWERYAMI
ncbi:MAG: bifunctional [glutamate--ammonia ligase]-adenylyl-L-tyrosine phosphorylase/[glutamate--ammonia-ligase] adenylyltransferase, partial [Desulfobacterales bacterium]|nr:bifunctional [glutamate--ammonia ligase]-adenylyl-L-tyrosine phosphorylase/[glutamate--ammonia-ligase] adenylyltransferase [Desulfobacterales bacterium]